MILTRAVRSVVTVRAFSYLVKCYAESNAFHRYVDHHRPEQHPCLSRWNRMYGFTSMSKAPAMRLRESGAVNC